MGIGKMSKEVRGVGFKRGGWEEKWGGKEERWMFVWVRCKGGE